MLDFKYRQKNFTCRVVFYVLLGYVCLRHDLRIGVCNLLQFTWL